MSGQIARNHHFVPQWYQRRFLAQGESEFWVFDKSPLSSVTGPDGAVRKIAKPKEIRRSGPKVLFQETDLYAVQLPQVPPDQVEKAFFGPVDDAGARANGMLARWPETMGMMAGDAGIPRDVGHPTERMFDLLGYMDAQKTRTPKGLDQLRADLKARGVSNPNNATLMRFLMQRRQFHLTIWAECHWEIFSAAGAATKFLLSDDPVVLFNKDCYPASAPCRYPADPDPFWRGTRVIYPLSTDQLLVLTHAEHMDDPSRAKARTNRRNARAYGDVLVSYTDIVNYRSLSEDQIASVNHVLKTRARRFVASTRQADLYPEKTVGSPRWSEIDALFAPEYPSHMTRSETIVSHTDDSILFTNAFGERDRVPGWFVRQQRAKQRKDGAA